MRNGLTKRTILTVLTILLVFAGCQKKGNTLDAKKQELDKLKTQLVEIQKKINSLEKEINAGENGNSGNVVTVNYVEIKPDTFKRYIEVQGSLVSDRTVMLTPKMPGQVTRIAVSEGQSVAQGAVLIEVDDRVMRKSLEELETAYELANSLFTKQKNLWDQKVISEVQYLQAKTNKESLEKRISTVKTQINDSKLIAPFAGVVDMITPKVGESVGSNTPVIRLTSMSGIKVIANVSETYVSTFKTGDPALIRFHDINENVPARITSVSKAIDPRSRTFQVDIKLPSINKNYRPNMVCSVSINDVTKEGSIIAPLSVVQREENKQFLFVAEKEDGWIARKRYIKTGLVYQDKVEILGGLKPGDLVITDGAFDVADGQPIAVKN